MLNYKKIYNTLKTQNQIQLADILKTETNNILTNKNNGNFPKFFNVLNNLPNIKPSFINLDSSSIIIGNKNDCDSNTKIKIEKLLRQLYPWRKGPYNLFSMNIDVEWRSDMKWDRLKSHIKPLKDKLVLDVGCGNGYHCWRMAGVGAKAIVGIDPFMTYVFQFHAINHFINQENVAVFPLALEDIQKDNTKFDSIFSMGVLYHRKDPGDHINRLHSLLGQDGELILETLIIDGKQGDVLIPEDRYARMKNVRYIPSCLTLESLLKQNGFKNIRLIDVSKTTSKEQRVTDWFGYESLADFLDPNDDNFTVEGYPAPKRAIFLAKI